MPRRSGRLSTGGEAVGKHKRAASGSADLVALAKRPKKQQTTPTKSQYFERANDDDDADLEAEDESETPSAADTGSEFGEGSQNSAGSPDPGDDDEGEEEEDEDDSNEATPRGKSASRTTGPWKPGSKTGLGPGKQLVVKKPKARPAGKVPYTDETIHPNTLLFLGELKANNERSWLKMHDALYRQAEKDWYSFVEKLTEKLTEIDDTVPELPVKDVIFRVYRDVRFSKDSTPYKPWFSAAWSRTGRKSTYAHYYIQIAPNKSWIGGGCWHPEALYVARMRNSIDNNSQALKDVLSDESIRKEFLNDAKKTDAAVVKAFVKSNSDNALKTKPKGYSAEHPDLDLLRLRSYTVGRALTDDEVLGEKGAQRIVDLLAVLKPYVTFLNSVVMPDHASSSSDEEEEDEEEGSDEGEEEAA